MLFREAHCYQCKHHHTFDIAKEGYVNLLLGNRKATGDQADMVHARTTFLSHGYYAPLQAHIAALLEDLQPHVLIDAGCGQGYYTNAFAAHLPKCAIYGFDLSKYALKAAAKRCKTVHYAVASAANIPLGDECCDVFLSIFAPLYEQEILRLLKKDAYFIRVGPGTHHLWEMKQALYEHPYENEHPKAMNAMTLYHEEDLKYPVCVQGEEDICALFSMTPYAYHSPKDSVRRLKKMKQLSVQLQFHIEIWRK